MGCGAWTGSAQPLQQGILLRIRGSEYEGRIRVLLYGRRPAVPRPRPDHGALREHRARGVALWSDVVRSSDSQGHRNRAGQWTAVPLPRDHRRRPGEAPNTPIGTGFLSSMSLCYDNVLLLGGARPVSLRCPRIRLARAFLFVPIVFVYHVLHPAAVKKAISRSSCIGHYVMFHFRSPFS